MVDVSDEFDIFDATPVTSNDEDFITSNVDHDGPTTADVDGTEVAVDGQGGAKIDQDLSSARFERQRRERYKRSHETDQSQCIHCRRLFENTNEVNEHECRARPISSCRFCGETYTCRDDPEDHLWSCREFRRYHEKEIRRARAHVYHGTGFDSFNRFEYIRPWYHEFSAYLHYDCRESENPLHSYYALNSLQKEHDWEEYGTLRTGFEIDIEDLPQVTRRQLHEANEFGEATDVEKWAVDFTFESSGIAVPDDDLANDLNWQLDEVREYRIKVYPAAYDTYTDAVDDGRKRASFLICPRWPDMEAKNGKNMSNPYGIIGFDVDTTGSNIQFERYPDLLYHALDALYERQGFRFSQPTKVHVDDFDPENIFKSSTITDAELYVRVKKDETGRVYAFDGTLHRVSMLLGGEATGYTKSLRDNTKCPGYYHSATIGPMRASEMLGGHNFAKELDHYHVKHPKAVEGGALEHPKIGASFQNSQHDETVYWSDLDRLERELDESVLNVLRWSDLPTSPDGEYFVADDYFQVVGDRRFRKVVEDQLPRLREQQDREVRRFAVAGNLTSTDINAIETLLTDGGVQSPADLAEQIGVHISTIYDAIERLAGLVTHRYGEVELASQYLAQQVLGKLKGARRAVEQTIEESIDDLVRGEQFAQEGATNAWDHWMRNCVERIEEGDGEGPAKLILGWTPADAEDARELLVSGALRWAEVTGNDIIDFAHEYSPVVDTADGEHLEWSWWSDFAKILPGFNSRYVG